MQHSFIRLPAVIARTGLSRSTIYRAVAANSFPAPVRISTRAVAWRTDALDSWISSRQETSL